LFCFEFSEDSWIPSIVLILVFLQTQQLASRIILVLALGASTSMTCNDILYWNDAGKYCDWPWLSGCPCTQGLVFQEIQQIPLSTFHAVAIVVWATDTVILC